MFALIVRMRIDPADGTRFEALFNGFGSKALADEPGTLTYALGRVRGEEGVYRAIEIYAGEDDFKAHVAGDAFQAFRPDFVALLAEPPASERLDIVS